jgi:C-terminal processing protease CtpA/Prc
MAKLPEPNLYRDNFYTQNSGANAQKQNVNPDVPIAENSEPHHETKTLTSAQEIPPHQSNNGVGK